MDRQNKQGRYSRVYKQLTGLLTSTSEPLARMATINAVLHHKMDGFFWTGFYLLHEGELVVGPYQGPVACQVLAKNTGVCWAAITSDETMVVPDVELFPGHIACDSRSKSEIALPLRTSEGIIRGVMDVDSQQPGNFDEIDVEELEKIMAMVYLSAVETAELKDKVN